MASTNKTTHYELSQYVGTDKPTYLTDYNNDMSAIDTGIYNAQTKADSAYSTANSADGKADQALNNAGTAQTDASTAITRIGTMANLDTTEKTNLVGAINEVKGVADEINKFNFTTFTSYDKDNVNVSVEGGSITGGTCTIAKNSDGSIIKVYGKLSLTKTNQTTRVTIANTGILPDSEISINPIGIEIRENASSYGSATAVKLKTNGSVELVCFGAGSGNNVELLMIPFVIFVKDFGDVA